VYTVIIETTFNASHQLTLLNGSKEPLHRHKWKVETAISGDKLDKMGLLIDFNRLKIMVESITAGLTGTQLEKTPDFAHINSSAENVARFIYERLEKSLDRGLMLDYIEVTEAPGCRARYKKT